MIALIIPTKIVMRNSWLYYLFWRINTELRDITLFHELLNKKRKPYRDHLRRADRSRQPS